MASKVILKKSSVAARVPVAEDLVYGELALNYTDGNLYYKTNTNTIAVLNAGTVTGVTGTAPVVSSGGTTPDISMAAATTSVPGYLTAADWTTFNGKQAALVSGTNIKTLNSSSLLGSGDISLFAGGLTGVEIVAALPGSPNANTLYIITG